MEILLDSELFQFHSERMCEIIAGDAQKVPNFFYEPSLQPKVRLRTLTCFTSRTRSFTTMVIVEPNFFDLTNAGNLYCHS